VPRAGCLVLYKVLSAGCCAGCNVLRAVPGARTQYPAQHPAPRTPHGTKH